MDLIKSLNDEKDVTTIMVTHDQRLAGETKRMVQMFDGVITKEIVK